MDEGWNAEVKEMVTVILEGLGLQSVVLHQVYRGPHISIMRLSIRIGVCLYMYLSIYLSISTILYLYIFLCIRTIN